VAAAVLFSGYRAFFKRLRAERVALPALRARTRACLPAAFPAFRASTPARRPAFLPAFVIALRARLTVALTLRLVILAMLDASFPFARDRLRI
jgi:hypothetical protein